MTPSSSSSADKAASDKSNMAESMNSESKPATEAPTSVVAAVAAAAAAEAVAGPSLQATGIPTSTRPSSVQQSNVIIARPRLLVLGPNAATSIRPEVHPTSRFLEAYREDDLTLWEVHRPPRNVKKYTPPSKRITCSIKTLNPIIRCVICLGYLSETTLVQECLHRFCRECIHKSIRYGKKECPSCRQPIPSRRSLKRDEKFDNIVRHIIGKTNGDNNNNNNDDDESNATGDNNHTTNKYNENNNMNNDKNSQESNSNSIERKTKSSSRKRPADDSDDETMDFSNHSMVNLQRAINKSKRLEDHRRQAERDGKETSMPSAAAVGGGGGGGATPPPPSSSSSSRRRSTNMPQHSQDQTYNQEAVTATGNTTNKHADNKKQAINTVDMTCQLLELELQRHPREQVLDRLERSFLTLRGDAKVHDLKTFLIQKLHITIPMTTNTTTKSEQLGVQNNENPDDSIMPPAPNNNNEDFPTTESTIYQKLEITSNLDDDSVLLDEDMGLEDARESLENLLAMRRAERQEEQDEPPIKQILVLKYRLTGSNNDDDDDDDDDNNNNNEKKNDQSQTLEQQALPEEIMQM